MDGAESTKVEEGGEELTEKREKRRERRETGIWEKTTRDQKGKKRIDEQKTELS